MTDAPEKRKTPDFPPDGTLPVQKERHKQQKRLRAIYEGKLTKKNRPEVRGYSTQ